MKENLLYLRDRTWAWFVERSHGKHALFWLAVCAFLDPIFFPIAPELYLGALMLAHPHRWARYLVVCILASIAGAAAGYGVAAFLFVQFGQHLVAFFGFQQAFAAAQQSLGDNVLITMLIVPFTIVPEKAFVLAAGFLKAPFVPFMIGFAVGRIARIALITYLMHRFGSKVMELVGRYFFGVTMLVVMLVTIYAMVHWHLLPL